MPNTVRTLSVVFNLRLKSEEIEAFRGAFIDFEGRKNDLFHNHDNDEEGVTDKIKYRYPLIHYRIQKQCASVYGINEGAKALDKLLRTKDLDDFKLNGKRCPMRVIETQGDSSFQLAFTKKKQKTYHYRIYNYLPLNPENYGKYKEQPDFVSKVQQLEKLLANHLVSFAHAVNWKFTKTQRLEVSIQDIDRIKKTQVLGTPMMAFDLVFSCNALLPDRLGIGRKPAFGFGWLYRLED